MSSPVDMDTGEQGSGMLDSSSLSRKLSCRLFKDPDVVTRGRLQISRDLHQKSGVVVAATGASDRNA